MRRLLPVLVLAASILVASCGFTRNHSIDVWPEAPNTGIDSGDKIVVVLVNYNGENTISKDLSSIERNFENCISTEMQRVDNSITFLTAAEFRKLISTASIDDDLTQPPNSLLQAFAEPVSAIRIAEAKVRYVALIQANYNNSTGNWRHEGAHEGGAVLWRNVKQMSYIKADVLDLKHARIAGWVSSTLEGDRGVGAGVVVIIPFPIFYNSDTENRNCFKFGDALARFIMGTRKP